MHWTIYHCYEFSHLQASAIAFKGKNERLLTLLWSLTIFDNGLWAWKYVSLITVYAWEKTKCLSCPWNWGKLLWQICPKGNVDIGQYLDSTLLWEKTWFLFIYIYFTTQILCSTSFFSRDVASLLCTEGSHTN